MVAKLKAVNGGTAATFDRHQPIPVQGAWLAQVVSELLQLSRGADRRSCTQRVPRQGGGALEALAPAAQPAGLHRLGAYEEARLRLAAETTYHCIHGRVNASTVKTPEVGAECPNWARSVLCGGRSAMSVPTAIAARGVQAADQDPSRPAGRRNRYHAVLGTHGVRPDHHAEGRRLENPRRTAIR